MAAPGKTEIACPVFAGAVVIGPEHKILCQLRDDKPGIIYPGFWTCSPGGHVEPGELPRDAIVRELREEFEIEVTGLRQLAVIEEPPGQDHGTYHAFAAELATPPERVKCNEGQRACFLTPDEIFALRVHPVSLKILRMYLESKER